MPWRPVDKDTPRDGTPILMCTPPTLDVWTPAELWRAPVTCRWAAGRGKLQGETFRMPNDQVVRHTHWMPLDELAIEPDTGEHPVPRERRYLLEDKVRGYRHRSDPRPRKPQR